MTKFGRDVVNLGTDKAPDYRIPESGLQAYQMRRRVFVDEPIAGRTEGELRRKAA